MEIQIISKEFIKPSSPTPHHLKTHKLSFLDQNCNGSTFPWILFYPNIVQPNSHLQILKHSLSKTLTRYYPFAGKIKDNSSIDCDDQGPYYVEARVSNFDSLSHFLSQPNLLEHPFLNKLILDANGWVDMDPVGGRVLKIQVTVFPCGGIVIGYLVSHLLTDGHGFNIFLRDWAATARKQGQLNIGAPTPTFNASSLFPPMETFPANNATVVLGKKGRSRTKRFVFNGSAIVALKARASAADHVQNPTRIEAVSALMWKSVMAAFVAKSGVRRPCLAAYPVNFRRRADPPFPEHSVGNLILSTSAQSEHCTDDTKNGDAELQGLVRKVREAIKKVDGDVVKKIQGEGGYSQWQQFRGQVFGPVLGGTVDLVGFSSWRFGLYEVDFGWGKPGWISCVGFGYSEPCVYANIVVMMDTKCGEGQELWVTLGEQEMSILENDKELLAFASKDPNPLEIGQP